MSLILKRINKLTELVPGKTYLLFNNDIESSIDKNRNNSCTNIKILDAKPMLAVAKVDINDQILIRQDMLRNLLYIYDLDNKSENVDTNNDVVALKRKIRKLEKKNAKLNGALSKHNIDLNKNKKLVTKKNNKGMKLRNTYRQDIFGYDVFVTVKTNDIDRIEITMSLDVCENTYNETIVDEMITVKGIAIKHEDDIFNYKLGKQLAYTRAMNKLMERIVQE